MKTAPRTYRRSPASLMKHELYRIDKEIARLGARRSQVVKALEFLGGAARPQQPAVSISPLAGTKQAPLDPIEEDKALKWEIIRSGKATSTLRHYRAGRGKRRMIRVTNADIGQYQVVTPAAE